MQATAQTHDKLLLAATLVHGYPTPLNIITDAHPTHSPAHTSHTPTMNKNELITALRAYGPRSYEQDINTAWDHLLAAVRRTPPPVPTPGAAQTAPINSDPTPDETATTQ